ncbi:Hypothetical_protein [Hexamita inflata]|uniref:Hypothetical_protein n=1 Tax=Hexamita inflata TaxID=28002 RepID=A0AA86PC45_9EUKA|nr:Hypothetical protein HINF_LOCUS23547 [Hexamita inflata]
MQRHLQKQSAEHKQNKQEDISQIQSAQSSELIQQAISNPSVQSKLRTKSKISRISSVHTDLFDISENSLSNSNLPQHQTLNINTASISSEKSLSQYIFWDESSVIDIKLLKVDNGEHGKRKIEQIIISTEKYTSSTIDKNSSVDSLFSSIF